MSAILKPYNSLDMTQIVIPSEPPHHLPHTSLSLITPSDPPYTPLAHSLTLHKHAWSSQDGYVTGCCQNGQVTRGILTSLVGEPGFHSHLSQISSNMPSLYELKTFEEQKLLLQLFLSTSRLT